MKFSGVALAAMLAQLFLGKIAFLAGASLLLSKLALIFSIFVSFFFLLSSVVLRGQIEFELLGAFCSSHLP